MFSRFERMVAGRFLRARRTERFVSVIALFSLIGIALGVATLIIVLSVMNGFRQELLDRVLGINGHLIVHAERAGEGIDGFDAIADTIRTLPRVTLVTPTIEAQAMATSSAAASGATSTESVPGVSVMALASVVISTSVRPATGWWRRRGSSNSAARPAARAPARRPRAEPMMAEARAARGARSRAPVGAAGRIRQAEPAMYNQGGVH